MTNYKEKFQMLLKDLKLLSIRVNQEAQADESKTVQKIAKDVNYTYDSYKKE